jgi:hypothetical protein
MKKLTNKIKFHLMRFVKSKKSRDYFVNKISKKIGKSIIPKIKGKKFEIKIDQLNKHGYYNLGEFLDPNEIINIKNKISKLMCFDPFRKELGEFQIENTPKEVHVANYKRKDLVNIKEILNIANNTSILNAVQEYLGATPTISNINMWWSFSGKENAEDAQFFHRDVDDFKFIKLFIYLTDVAMENGPHVYVQNTSSSPILRKIRRYKDQEIHDAFGKDNVKYFTAPKGSSFLVDTYGFHKGLLPKKGKRLLLQVQYSLRPIGNENYKPYSIRKHDFDKYINRLIIE